MCCEPLHSDKRKYGRFNSVAVLGILIISCLVDCESDSIQQPVSCDRHETLLRAKHVYTYQYTITTSSSFVGATESRSGSQIKCKVTVSVPRKCELILELSACDLKEKVSGKDESYSNVEGAEMFVQELERFPVYFQMDKGVVLEDSIVVSDQEPVDILNIKRGLISQLQFPFIDNTEITTETDIFGSCPVEYSYIQETPNTLRTKRNLRKCQLPQVFKKQFAALGSMVRAQLGGYTEEQILEGIYPFVSEVTCDYTLGDDKTLDEAKCLQQQYFAPLAYKGDILATAMSNISQHLVLESFKIDKTQPRPSYDLDSRHTKNIQFEFVDDTHAPASQAQLLSLLTEISGKFDTEDFEMVPGLFGDSVELFRSSAMAVLASVKDDVFQCGEECSAEKKIEQSIFLDMLASCGTDNCLEVYLDCVQNGHAGRLQRSFFLQSLAAYHTVSENFLAKLLLYCKSSGTTSCWLSLGTLLSKLKIGEETVITPDSIVGQTLDHLIPILTEQCTNDGLTISQREVVKTLKTIENIGYRTVMKEAARMAPPMQNCLTSPNIPKPVVQAILQIIHTGLYESNFMLPPSLKELLLSLLKDVAKDTTLRATAFTLLMKTIDKDTVKELVKYLGEPNSKQMKSYMMSNVKTLLENDEPPLKSVRRVWEEVKREDEDFSNLLLSGGFNQGLIGMSKTVNIAHFFKFPITDYLGGQLYMDLIYDPSAILFSQFKVSVNYFHRNQRYNLFEVTADVQGFDMLLETLLGNNDLHLMQLFALYKQSKVEGQGEAGTLYDKFQKNMIRKVMEILELVNHPKFPDFEFAVHLKIFGKNVHFLSLRDLMEYARKIQAHTPPGQPTMSQKLMGLLKQGVGRMLFGPREMASLVKQIPTCAGLPLNMTVRANTFYYVSTQLSADVTEYLQKTGPLTADWTFAGLVAAELKGQLTIPVGACHSSGIALKALIGGGRHMHMDMKYSHVIQGRESSTPFSGTLEIDIHNVDRYMDPEILFYAKSKMLLLHHSGQENVQRDSALETKYERCFPDWLVAATGRSLCVNFDYLNVTTSKTHAYFPLSGPFELEVKIAGADRDFDVHNMIWKYEVENSEGVILKHVYFTHYGKGSKLTRLIYNNMTYNREEGSLNIDLAIPEAGFEYIGRLRLPSNPGSGIDLMDFIWMSGKPYFGYFIKGHSRSETKEGAVHTDKLLHVNLTAPLIGWDIKLKKTAVQALPEIESEYEVALSYYCSKELPFFHMFHMNPLHAAENGDITLLKIKNNFKTTIIAAKPVRWTADDVFTLNYPGQTVTMVTDMRRENGGAHRNSVITYLEDGEPVTVTMTANVISHGEGLQDALDMEYEMKIEADDFNVDVNGKVTGNLKDLDFHMDATYTKSENEARKKRSLKTIYETFKKLEEAAVNRVIQIEEAILGKPKPSTEVTDDVKLPPTEDHPPFQFPPVPQFPSIWDLPTWTATCDFKVKAKPVFGPTPGPPKGMEFVWSLDWTHPWDAGYRTYTGSGILGRNMKNSFKYFHFWGDLTDSIQYSDLEGNVKDIPGFPTPIARSAHFHIERESGHIFDTKLEAHSPLLNFTYLILFDWEAIGHHEPLVHVKSSMANKLLPLMDHDYEEFFTYEPGYVKHTTSFSHKFLSVNLETSFDYRGPEWVGLQTGKVTVLLPIVNIGETLEFANDFRMQRAPGYPRLTSTVTGSDKTTIYKLKLEHPRAISVHRFLKTTEDSTDDDLPWQYKALIELQGSSTFHITFEWKDTYDQRLQQVTVANLYQLAGYLQLVAAKMKENLGLAIMERKFILINMEGFQTESPKNLLKKYVLPKAVLINSLLENFMANFILLKHRQALIDAPGPYIPPRFRILLQSAVLRGKVQPTSFVRVMEKFMYYGVKAAIPVVYKLAGKLQQKQQEANRKITFAIPVFTAMDHFMQIPRPKEAIKTLLATIYQIRYRFTGPQSSADRMAVIYGKRAHDRPLNIMTFDNEVLQIPAESASSCSYLLMADTPRRDAVVLSTPVGLSLVTMATAVTFGYDKNVYLDDCKIPLKSSPKQQDLNGISINFQADRVSISKETGLSLICYLELSDVCIISWSGSHLNETIGLLGNNDYDGYTDRRKPDGKMGTTFSNIVSEYVVSGPAECYGTSTKDSQHSICNTELHEYCFGLFKDGEIVPDGTCRHFVDTASFMQACLAESQHCNSKKEDVCHAYLAYTHLCESGGLDPAVAELPEVCKLSTEPDGMFDLSINSGSLDVVFVISQHSSMAKGYEPWRYLYDLLNDAELEVFDEVRVGIVGFAGLNDNSIPYVLKQGGRYFTNLDEIDWTSLEGLQTEGSEPADGFEAIKLAALFPFSPTAHKMIALLMTKEQGTGEYDNLSTLQDTLAEQNIIFNLFSTYAKLSSKKVIGIDWEGRVISRVNNLQDKKALPQNDYIKLMTASKGAVFDILTISRGRQVKIERILEHFILQAQENNNLVCPAE